VGRFVPRCRVAGCEQLKGRAFLRIVIARTIAFASCAGQQPGSGNFEQLAAGCVPQAPIHTLRAIVRVESAFHTYAMSLNYPASIAKRLGYPPGRVSLRHQPIDLNQALQWTALLARNGISVSLGLMQVNTEQGARMGLTPRQILDPCTNLRAGWSIYSLDYVVALGQVRSPGMAAKAALSLYNTGQLWEGFSNGYVDAVISAANK
jgi:type IV secretion system protein VirB1